MNRRHTTLFLGVTLLACANVLDVAYTYIALTHNGIRESNAAVLWFLSLSSFTGLLALKLFFVALLYAGLWHARKNHVPIHGATTLLIWSCVLVYVSLSLWHIWNGVNPP